MNSVLEPCRRQSRWQLELIAALRTPGEIYRVAGLSYSVNVGMLSLVFSSSSWSGCSKVKMGSSMKVLVVEDEPLMASFIARGLRENCFTLDIDADGGQAIAKVDNQDYDLVILDLRLQAKDVFTACR